MLTYATLPVLSSGVPQTFTRMLTHVFAHIFAHILSHILAHIFEPCIDMAQAQAGKGRRPSVLLPAHKSKY